MLQGKQLFYDARDTRLARDGYMSCASCHNDGGHDGRVWDLTGLGEGLRNTISLRGRGGRARADCTGAATSTRCRTSKARSARLAGGTGLMSDAQFNTGTRSQPLGDRQGRLSADLDALAAYVGSLTELRAEPAPAIRDGALTAAALAGSRCSRAATARPATAAAAFTNSLGDTR